MSSTKFKLPVTITELNLDLTLQCGQSFRWFKIDSERWRGVLGNRIWTLYQNKENLFCDVTNGSKNGKTDDINKCKVNTSQKELENTIKQYFRLDINSESLYKKWANVDQNFARVSSEFRGIRILDQDPVENVFSFICSSNNNIERITKLVEALCTEFGSFIDCVDDKSFYSFPAPQKLSVAGVEEKLRKLGFGYRAKYIYGSAKVIEQNGGSEYLQNLKRLSYKDCHEEISKLHGVGPKVADCICLMSMGHLEAIPVDTHVFQIAVRDYLPHLRDKKSVSAKVYTEVADHFRTLFGPYAGWAHSVLFTADLRKFKTSCDPKPVKRMKKSCSSN